MQSFRDASSGVTPMTQTNDHGWLPCGYVSSIGRGLLLTILVFTGSSSLAGEANRLSYVDSNEVWFPHKDFPKLITPQWVGEDGVDCVVTLAIDDMRDPAKYEAYLRPILQRLKQIDGRAPVSIMTCNVKPDDPQLQVWLNEGLSLECHTADHPCPILNGGDLGKSKATYDKCVDLMALIPNNSPVAFRTPCCDSLNTVSPRLFSEIINRTTATGNFLQLDSSVFTVYTADDPSIPRELLIDGDGREKFRKYIPRKLKRGDLIHDGFVNTIENYPYPYVIQGTCWEFPCMVPSDWSANHLQQPNNPETVRDLKVALDITVQKQGVFNLVFHPHGWIKAEQVIELIDHAVARHGRRVKFLTFKEALERLNQNVLNGHSLKSKTGSDQLVRLIDLNSDGFMDCATAEGSTRIWHPATHKWQKSLTLPTADRVASRTSGVLPVWGLVKLDFASLTSRGAEARMPEVPGKRLELARSISLFDFNQTSITPLDFFDGGSSLSAQGCHWERPSKSSDERFLKVMLRDIDGDDICDLFGTTFVNGRTSTHVWIDPATGGHNWRIANWQIPEGVNFVLEDGNDAGLRLADINEDGKLDLVFSNQTRCGAWLFESGKGWTTQLLNVQRGKQPGELEFPPIALDDGSDNGFFVKDRQLCWINEKTDGLADFVMRIAFDKLLGDRLSEAKSPEAARLSMRTSPGLRVDLVAHEPLTMDPVALDWGPDEKMWVAEMADYPRGVDGQGKPGGRIRFLEDLDGDGVYDRSTLFLEDVPFPNGVLAWKRGVLVSAAPDVFYAEDLDGDGKADRKSVLFTGFAEGNQQHRANGFSRGLDNWIYLANGDSGGTVQVVAALDAPGRWVKGEERKSVDIRGRDIRIRPDSGEIEAVAGQSQFGRNRDDWGNWFGNNNSRPIWHYLLDDHYLRRNPNLIAPQLQKDVSVVPGAAPVFPTSRTLTRFNDFHTANRFTSACSSMVYRDTLFRDVPGGEAQVFISEPVHNLVHREVMTAQGLSFTSRRAPVEAESELLSSTDNWFRPTQLKTGPDGALYVADMYRLVIEHPQWIPIEWQRKLDLRAGHDKGRIWRVAPVNHLPRAIPRLDKCSVAELVRLLRHSNGWQRDLAQQLLIDRADLTSIPLLGMAAREPALPAADDADADRIAASGRLHALCTLEGLSALQSLRGPAGEMIRELLPSAIGDSHPGVRRHAIRISETFPGTTDAFWQSLNRRVDDADAQVRLQLAYSLGELNDPRAASALGRLAVNGAVPAETDQIDPLLLTAILSSLKTDNLELVLAEVMGHGSDRTELLQQMLAQATAFNHEGSLVSLLNRATEPNARGGFERWQYVAIDQFLLSLDRRFTTLDKWLSGLSPIGTPVAARLQRFLATARQVAADDNAGLEDRAAAIRLLGQSAGAAGDIEFLAGLMSPSTSPQLQATALSALARVKLPQIGDRLIANYRSLPPGLRAQTNDILLSRDSWRESFIHALESKQITAAEVDVATRQRLLDHKSKTVSERAARVFSMDINSDRARLVAEYLPAVRGGGDVQWGSQLFKKVCSQCHKLGSVGHAVGPDLVSLTDKSPDALLAAILDPNRAVESKFLAFTVVTKAGLAQTGILSAETAGSVTLRAAEGKETTFLRSEIEELQSNSKSLMPDGLERDLKPTDIAALVAYIRMNVPLPAMKSFPGNAPRVITSDADGKFLLTPFDGEIYGSTIVIEEKHRNLGWWSSADDVVVWTIEVPKPGKYSVIWTFACDATASGNRLLVEAGGKTLTHRVDKTRDWDDYQVQTIGDLELPAGQVRVTLKPAARPLPALADVKQLVLIPKN